MEVTIHNLHLATAQEVFEHISKHLLNQNKKSLNRLRKCVYLNEEGLKCAAGSLIPKEDYSPKWEGWSWGSSVQKSWVSNSHLSLIQTLQYLHDTESVLEWRESLIQIGKSRGLDTDFINQIQN